MSEKQIYHNRPQVQLQLVDTQIMYARWGRATGKTQAGAWWVSNRMNNMARSGGTIVGSTYTHLLTKLAPGIIRAWEALGFQKDVHFWYNRFPPKKYKIPNGYQPLMSPKYSIFWYNGSYCQFLSAERGLSNALSADFHYFDEARFLPYDKIREITLTARGNFHHFGGHYRHGSMLFTTDAPRSAKSQWINEKEQEMDAELIQLIEQVAVRMNLLKLEYHKAGKTKQKQIAKQVKYYEKWLDHARQQTVFFSRAKTTENIYAIGPQAIWNFKKILSPTDYLISVLNEDGNALPNSFYPLLNEEIHGFHSENTGYIERLNLELSDVEKDCLWKSPKHYSREAELDIALDYNNAINSLVVGQGDVLTYRLLNSFFVLGEHKEYLRDVVKKFCHFYRHHKNRIINYYFDQTAIPKDPTGRVIYKDEVIGILRKHNFRVKEHRIWQASSHDDRFYFWLRLMSGKDPRLPQFYFDIDDCEQWRISAEGAGVKQTEKGFKKDKSTETKKDKEGNLLIRPEDSTHLSEAADTLLDGKFGHCLVDGDDSFVGESYM